MTFGRNNKTTTMTQQQQQRMMTGSTARFLVTKSPRTEILFLSIIVIMLMLNVMINSKRLPFIEQAKDIQYMLLQIPSVPKPLRSTIVINEVEDGYGIQVARMKNISSSMKKYKNRDFSPYVYRWYPDRRVPRWAQKFGKFRVMVPDDKRICFVHVGKAGGSSIGCSLGFNLHCNETEQEERIPVGMLPLMATNTFHNDVNDCPFNPPPAYNLFTVRDPLERAVSAFNYDKQGDREWEDGGRPVYHGCGFRTIHEFAIEGLAPDGTASRKCKELAYNVIRGDGEHICHLYNNYRYYAERALRPESGVLVLRINHLEEDWKAAEAVMGGDPNVNIKFPRENSGLHRSDDDLFLTPESKKLLCEGLCEEIQVYKHLLMLAENVSPKQKQESLAELAENCPKEAYASSCSDPAPEIQQQDIPGTDDCPTSFHGWRFNDHEHYLSCKKKWE